MLFKYQNKYKKIVMDMISLLPKMNLIDHLEDEMNWYSDDDHRSLYLWKDSLNNWGGLVGIEEFPYNILIRRLILNSINDNDPRNNYEILDEVSKMYPKKRIIGTIQTTKICNKWEKQHNRNNE